MPSVSEIDHAILALHRGPGAFTQARLRDQLRVSPLSLDAKRIANRLQMLKKTGVLRTEGEYKRNRVYIMAKGREAAFARRVQSTPSVASNGRPRALPNPPLIPRALARLAEFDDLKPSLQDLTAKVNRIEVMVTELHAGLFGQPTQTAQTSEGS